MKAQKRLNALGCHAGPPDGDRGPWTRSAVVRFQSRVGMAQSGRLDKRTRQRLYAENAPRCDVRPIPAGSGKGRRIVISQRQNWVWLVGRQGKVVTQGGMVDNPGVLQPRFVRRRLVLRPRRPDQAQPVDQRQRLARQLRAVRTVRHRLPPDPALQVDRQPDPRRLDPRHQHGRVARLHPALARRCRSGSGTSPCGGPPSASCDSSGRRSPMGATAGVRSCGAGQLTSRGRRTACWCRRRRGRCRSPRRGRCARHGPARSRP